MINEQDKETPDISHIVRPQTQDLNPDILNEIEKKNKKKVKPIDYAASMQGTAEVMSNKKSFEDES